MGQSLSSLSISVNIGYYHINQRNKLKRKNKSPEIKKKIENIELTISNMEAKETRDKIIKNFEQYSNNPENVNLQAVWKVLKRIGPKHGSPMPIAKRNFRGKLVSTPSEIKKLLAKEYKQRLRDRPLRPDLGDLRDRRNEIF